MIIWKKIQQFQRETRVIADARRSDTVTFWHSSLALQLDDLHLDRSEENQSTSAQYVSTAYINDDMKENSTISKRNQSYW